MGAPDTTVAVDAGTLAEREQPKVPVELREGLLEQVMVQSINEDRYATATESTGDTLRGDAYRKIVHRADSAFDFFSLLLPVRIAAEELGDAKEDIERRVKRGDSRWKIGLRAATAIVWAFWHAAKFPWSSSRETKGAGSS